MKGTNEERAEFTKEIENRVDDVLREFQDMELKQMRKGEIKARAKLAEVRKGFSAKRDNVRKALEEATKASSAAWTDVRGGVESAWEDLHTALEEARAQFSDADEVEAKEKESQPA